MKSKKEGYIVLALGPSRYMEMAANLAASIKVMDPGRPICLVYDAGVLIPNHLKLFFDDQVELEKNHLYPHVMNKLRLFEISPYESNMFVDADCLLVKKDVNLYWERAASRFFSITGGKRTNGNWKGVDIEKILKKQNINYLIQMNSGVFYFNKSTESKIFFEDLNKFYIKNINELNISIYRGKKTQTDELYIGIFMGLKGMDCSNTENFGINSWMVSTWRSLWCNFDFARGYSVIYKGDSHLFGIPFLPRKIVRLSPTFAHFIGLKPKRVYSRLSKEFRRIVLENTLP